MLAKFDPVGDRNFWLQSFLDYVRTSDPEESHRPHGLTMLSCRRAA